MTQELTRQTPCALQTPSRRTWRIRRSGVYPQPILSPWHARNVAVAAVALLHAAVMLAMGAVFLSCCHCMRATCYALARPSISEWVDIWRIEGLLTQKLYRNGCIGPSKINNGGITFRLFAHTNREHASTSCHVSCAGFLSAFCNIFPHCEESCRRRRRGNPQ